MRIQELNNYKDCRIIELPGKHGEIKLIVPNRKPTDEEWQILHRVIAETIVNAAKLRQLRSDSV